MYEASGQELDHGELEVCGGTFDVGLEVFGEASIAGESSEAALHDSAPRQDGEASCVLGAGDDFDPAAGGVTDALAGVGPIGEDGSLVSEFMTARKAYFGFIIVASDTNI